MKTIIFTIGISIADAIDKTWDDSYSEKTIGFYSVILIYAILSDLIDLYKKIIE